jgi:CBS domain containing-hemolysin-like protein
MEESTLLDSDNTLLTIALAVSALAFLALEVAGTVLRLVRRSQVTTGLADIGLRASAVRKLRMSNPQFADLIITLRFTAIATAFAATAGLLSASLSLAWPLVALGLGMLWATLFLLRPLASGLALALSPGMVVNLAVVQVIVLWPFSPLAKPGQIVQKYLERGPRPGEGAGIEAQERQEQGPTVEEQIAEEPLEPFERMMIQAILRLEGKAVREIMVPRVDMDAVNADSTLDQATERVVESGHSRLPVYKESMDNIVGMLYARDLLKLATDGGVKEWSVQDIARPCYFVPDSKHIDELLGEFQSRRMRIAVVVDEYGGVDGIVTLNDVLEEIVGDIQDEFDSGEPTIEQISEGEAMVDARIPVDNFNVTFNSTITAEGFDTLGGFLLSQLGKIPVPGDLVGVDELNLEVVSTVGRRIKKVRVSQAPASSADDSEEAASNKPDEQ